MYHDGQHNDSRMNTALIMSAVKHGAVVANYAEVMSFYKSGEKLSGARVRDELTGEEFIVHARVRRYDILSSYIMLIVSPRVS